MKPYDGVPEETDSKPAMARREFLKTSLVGAAATMASPAVGGVFVQGDRKASPRPNILYIHSHDTGRYVGPYGHAIDTSNLQRLAEHGILFRGAFCAAPTCSPSRASLLTGMCPHSNGMLGLAHRGFSLNDYRQHIIHTLRKEAGYYSALIGLQHIAKNPEVIGYDYVRSPIKKPGVSGANRVDAVTPVAVDYIKSQARAKEPFWLTVGFFETHRPYLRPGPEDDWRYTAVPRPIPDALVTERDMAAFKATTQKLDWGMGEVFKALDETGLLENTLVIATTDHGIAFPRMKCFLFDGGMGVNLIMRGPGGFSGGKILNSMISQIDLFPTICDLLQIDHPSWLQGKSFMPVIRWERPEINDEIFAEVNYHAAYEPKRAVRTRRWKYIRHFGNRRRPVLPNCDGSPSKELWLSYNWRDKFVAPEGLYDLVFDPNEQHNLAGDSRHSAVLEEMRSRLNRWMHSTHDPLLHGVVKAPAGAIVSDPDDFTHDFVHTVL